MTSTETTSRTGFAGDLNRAVTARLGNVELADGRRRLHTKAAIIFSWYVLSYVAVLLASGWWQGVLACLSLAFALAGVGFNIQHDANHNAFFDPKGSKRLTRANAIAGWSMYALGADAKRWIYDHGTLHHSAPNVVDVDTDIDLFGLARLAPAQEWKPWHVGQHIYIWLLYCLIPLEIMMSDIRGLVNEARHPTTRRPRPSLATWTGAILTKLGALTMFLVVPAMFHPWWVVLLGVAGIIAVTGTLLGVVFQPAHVVQEAAFGDEEHRGDTRWHEWQVRSSLDFSHGNGPASRMLRWYIGGLDHQTEHHLFPGLPHTVYPSIAPVVSEVCAEYGITHHIQPSMRAALLSHARHVRSMGKKPAN